MLPSEFPSHHHPDPLHVLLLGTLLHGPLSIFAFWGLRPQPPLWVSLPNSSSEILFRSYLPNIFFRGLMMLMIAAQSLCTRRTLALHSLRTRCDHSALARRREGRSHQDSFQICDLNQLISMFRDRIALTIHMFCSSVFCVNSFQTAFSFPSAPYPH